MKHKGLLILLTAVIITFGICVAPAAIFKIQDYKLTAKAFPYNSPTEKLSPKALDIALVRALRERKQDYQKIYEADFSLSYQDEYSTEEYEVISAQLKALEAEGVLPVDSVSNRDAFGFYYSEIATGIKNKVYLVKVVSNLYPIEVTNEKITQLTLPNIDNEFSSLNTTRVIKSYLSYLGLDILEDWEYKGSYAQSTDAGLKVICLVDNDFFTLGVSIIS